MNLDFRLLIIDDHPDSISDAILILKDYLDGMGFTLSTTIATDLSEAGIKTLAKKSGKDFDLVVVDYNLGRTDNNGVMAAAQIRRQLLYTDIVFYSSDSTLDLFNELAKKKVVGVFIADRTRDLDAAFVGLADTIIGKAVDLNHMRGIAMAEVAEMDVLMGDTIVLAFSEGQFPDQAKETLAKLLDTAKSAVTGLEPLVSANDIMAVVSNSRHFSSAGKYMTMRRIAKVLKNKPDDALATLNTYEADIIHNRNTLAHAKSDSDERGVISLRSIKHGGEPIVIDEAWMADFRSKLRIQKEALGKLCDAIREEFGLRK
ncbi:CheY-like chemotaxis protein [Aminobacter aminovorans]|uniref:Response regulatory domain-containing protein n=1 Tax=Aminobacter aminovorans TaxID=83263 RepID=A0A380WP65_AMIAI|nr:response regulator [Aminobacter aminovorans]TCS29888.1 CheY-like chemotaxis protein [Aminobacter aminovorans]SUU90737.1 Uncharacterised protein [Aminobacter aminovorans]